MDLSVFLIVLLAAVLHAVWNALVKNADDKYLGMLAITLGHLPLAVLAVLLVPLPAAPSWPFIAVSAALHCGYQLFLLWSYKLGDLSHVYPMARGVAPIIVAVVSVTFLSVTLSGSETIAILTIAVGIMSLVLVRGSDGLHNPGAAAAALTTGCFIAAYSLVDGTGVRQAGTALGYYGWVTIINAAAFALAARIVKPGLIGRVHRQSMTVALVGGSGSFIAYALVVWAFTQAPIALVTALRETSIVFAVLIGTVVLKERLSLAKLASTAITLFGAVLLRIAR